MHPRTLAAALATLLLLASLSACGGDDSEETPEARVPTTTAPQTPVAPGVEQLSTTDAGRDELIACLADSGVEAEPGSYVGVASGPEAEFHFEGPSTEVHLDPGVAAEATEHGHEAVATVVTFSDEETARGVDEAWSATGESVREGASVILGEPAQAFDSPEVDAARGCLAD